MPMPSVLPTPLPPSEWRLPAPLEAQEASYLAASASTDSFCMSSMANAGWHGSVSGAETAPIHPSEHSSCRQGADYTLPAPAAVQTGHP